MANQIIEDQGQQVGVGRQGSTYHAYNAVLRNQFGKPRGQMTLAELEAVVGWLERHRLVDHLRLLDKNSRYRFSAGQRGHMVHDVADWQCWRVVRFYHLGCLVLSMRLIRD